MITLACYLRLNQRGETGTPTSTRESFQVSTYSTGNWKLFRTVETTVETSWKLPSE